MSCICPCSIAVSGVCACSEQAIKVAIANPPKTVLKLVIKSHPRLKLRYQFKAGNFAHSVSELVVVAVLDLVFHIVVDDVGIKRKQGQ
ncbi:MAG TPA: hypothetical protein VFC39_21065, partial [Acidobacteriaceae bacterium]|nr:hypothetical protein [Acidobacteriaceae bacterium]